MGPLKAFKHISRIIRRPGSSTNMQPPLFQLTTEQWQKKLSPEEFKVLRLGKTEKSFTKQFITNPKFDDA